MKQKLLVVFGTRPEAIKLAPLIHEARKYPAEFVVRVAVTAQHRRMLDDVLNVFSLSPDYDFNLMQPNQSLFYTTSMIFREMENVLLQEKPDIVVVQGDTCTTFATALSGYYAHKKIAHVEAGLRTGNKYSPFPEEIYRKITSCVADYHFAPTEWTKQNLLNEGYPEDKIYVTGNTVVDALFLASDKIDLEVCPIPELEEDIYRFERMILITGHRRENFGEPFREVCEAFRILATQNPDICFVYPVHLNPNVQKPVREILAGLPNFFLLPPLAYLPFLWLMNCSYFIITDSGGIQEEAPSLGKPVLVTREMTERPEGVEAGTIRVVGTHRDNILAAAHELLTDKVAYKKMSTAHNPFGDGAAAHRIVEILKKKI